MTTPRPEAEAESASADDRADRAICECRTKGRAYHEMDCPVQSNSQLQHNVAQAITDAEQAARRAERRRVVEECAEVDPLDVVCPTCGQAPGGMCWNDGPLLNPHRPRRVAAVRALLNEEPDA